MSRFLRLLAFLGTNPLGISAVGYIFVQSLSKWIKWYQNNHFVNQWYFIDSFIKQWFNHSFNHPFNHPSARSFSHSSTQSVNQQINDSVDQSISLSTMRYDEGQFDSIFQLHLPLELINQNNFPQWMGIFKAIMERPIPEVRHWQLITRLTGEFSFFGILLGCTLSRLIHCDTTKTVQEKDDETRPVHRRSAMNSDQYNAVQPLCCIP